jgi:hypothetical protein
LALAALAGLVSPTLLAADDLQRQPYGPEVVLRWEPTDDSLAPIAPEQMKVGCIYNHFNRRLQRRVWSYLRADRRFWNAYGPGTLQEDTRFDLVGPQEEVLKWLKKIRRDRQDRPAYLKLDANNRWTLDETAGTAAIYDLETGMRWERHHVCYIPVVHVCGDCWGYAEGQYFPWD